MAGTSHNIVQQGSITSSLHQTPSHSPAASSAKESNGEIIEVLEFLLGQNLYAITLFDVKEVVEYSRITRLPNSPPYILGIIDLRGEITTIVDLKQQLSITATGELSEEDSRVIVLDDRLAHSKIGIMVDDVLSVSTFTKEDIDRTATSDDDGSHIKGIIKKSVSDKEGESKQLLIWLDVQRLIRDMENQ